MLFADDSSEEQRTNAARALLADRRIAPLVEALAPEAPRAAGLAVARAVRHTSIRGLNGAGAAAPDELLRPLIGLLANVESADKGTILEAIGAYATRDAIRASLGCIGQEQPAAVRQSAFAALRRQTGRDDLGTDVGLWNAWWNEVQWLPEGEWRNALARAQAARAARLDQQRAALAERIVEMHRRQFSATAHTERSPLLVQMMGDELIDIRRLALELADRELLNARPLGDSVIAATIERLRDESPEIRASAATLLGNLTAGAAHERILRALQTETHPHPAAAMLHVVSRRPDGAGVMAALRWLDPELGAAGPAYELLLAAAERGVLVSPEVRLEALHATRNRIERRPTPELVRLLGAIGTSDDLSLIRELLTTGADDVRTAAADALAPRPESLDLLIEVASADAALHPPAARAIILHQPTAEGWRRLRSIAASSEEQRRESLERLAETIAPRELLVLANAAEDPEERIALLERRLNAGRENAGHLSTRARLHLAALLAETRLAIGNPEGALDATNGLLDGLPAHSFDTVRRRVVHARASALLWIGRLEDPELAEAPPALWIEALERCAADGLGHVTNLLDHIQGTLLEGLSDPERRRFESILATIPPGLRKPVGKDDAVDETNHGDGETGPDSTRLADGDDPEQNP